MLFLTLGLIIDAFGELRDQQEQVKEDMEVRHLWLGCGSAVGDISSLVITEFI